jgi:putative phosphoesterase
MNLGIISDTHGTVTPQALSALKGSDRILHAGDITTPDVIQALKTLAPVIAVRGNMDYGATASNLPPAEMLEFDGTCIYMLHNLHTLDLDPKAAGIHIVIHGHTHQADMKTIDTVLYFNPRLRLPRPLWQPPQRRPDPPHQRQHHPADYRAEIIGTGMKLCVSQEKRIISSPSLVLCPQFFQMPDPRAGRSTTQNSQLPFTPLYNPPLRCL